MEFEVLSGVATLLGVERRDDGAQLGVSFGIVPGNTGYGDVVGDESLFELLQFFRGRRRRCSVDFVFSPRNNRRRTLNTSVVATVSF